MTNLIESVREDNTDMSDRDRTSSGCSDGTARCVILFVGVRTCACMLACVRACVRVDCYSQRLRDVPTAVQYSKGC